MILQVQNNTLNGLKYWNNPLSNWDVETIPVATDASFPPEKDTKYRRRNIRCTAASDIEYDHVTARIFGRIRK